MEDLNSKLDVKELNEKYMKLAREDQKIVKAINVECVSCKDKSSTNCLKCKFCKRLTHETCARKFISEESITEKISNPGTFSCKECIVNPTINPEPIKDNLVQNFQYEGQLMLEMSVMLVTITITDTGRQEVSDLVGDITAEIINVSSDNQHETQTIPDIPKENHSC